MKSPLGNRLSRAKIRRPSATTARDATTVRTRCPDSTAVAATSDPVPVISTSIFSSPVKVIRLMRICHGRRCLGANQCPGL